MPRKTIIEAIKEVMRIEGKPMTVSEVYDAIVSSNLYIFKADKPVHIVRSQIRRHCKDLDFPSSSSTKHFEILQNGKYYLLQAPITTKKAKGYDGAGKKASLTKLKTLHNQFLEDFRRRVLDQVKRLDPYTFEQFCKSLLVAYGFRDVVVTQRSNDGGIDGHGRLKVGFAYFNVAFQCKRWTRGNIDRPEVDRFRGAIQGQFEQGIFFTTANFTQGAENSSFRAGAVTVVLINGQTIIDFMIEKQFGIETEHLPLHRLALDLVMSDEN